MCDSIDSRQADQLPTTVTEIKRKCLDTDECMISNFEWSGAPVVNGKTATGIINGIGYTYTTSINIETTSKIFAVSQYPRHGNIMGYSFRTKRHRYTVWVKNKKSTEPIYIEDIFAEELYDYDNDPLETDNIINYPEQQRIKTTFQTLAARFFNTQIVNEPEPVNNKVTKQYIKAAPNNKWANERSKVISRYVATEMQMNKNQAKFLQETLYDKYARNNELTSSKGLSNDEIEAIYKETFSMISQQLLSKFTKKQFERISELEREKMNELRK